MPSRRDPWFDNARWLAGSLVVVVHATSGFLTGGAIGQEGGPADWLHTAFWPFRLPLFSVLVGYFTVVDPRGRQYSGLLRMVLFPFLIVTGLHVILNLLFTGSPRFDPVVAQYTLWFLVAVLCWRVGAPYLMRFRHPLLISVIVSLASGVFASLWVFRIDSVAGFFPFFVIGLMLRENDTWLRTRTVGRGVTAAAIVAAWMALVSVIHHFNLIDRSAIGMVGDYGDGVVPNLIGSALRIGILAGGSAAALAVLHLMPRRFIPVISYVGAGGFTIYLMHGLVLRVLNRFGLLPTVADGEWALWVLVVFAFVLALVLGSKPVRRIVAPIVRPKARWLLIPDTRAKKPEPSAHEPRRVHPGSRAGEALGGR